MPRKRNPITVEQLCGVGRLARSMVAPAMEDQALWGFRDMSHSIVERLLLPDISHLVVYSLRQLGRVIRDLEIDHVRMARHVAEGWDWSGAAELDRLVAEGQDRDAAYRRIQTDDGA